MLADAALLLLLATVGILQRTHETTVIPAIMACRRWRSIHWRAASTAR